MANAPYSVFQEYNLHIYEILKGGRIMRLLLLFPIFPRSIPHIVHQTVPTKNHGTNADTLHEKLPQYSHPRLPSVPPQIMQMHSHKPADSSHTMLAVFTVINEEKNSSY